MTDKTDHQRGCAGRDYTCTCGYDDAVDNRIEALTAENFKLAAGSCDVEGGKVGDERGHFYCTLQAKVEAQSAEIEQWRECALYDATMEGPVFKGWDRSALERCRRTALDALGFEIREKGQPWLRTYDEHLKGKPNGD